MKRACRFVASLIALCWIAQATPVNIQGLITFPDGSHPSGIYSIQSQAFTNAQGVLISPVNLQNIPIVNGVINISLEPNVSASPTGTSYRITYQLNGSPVFQRQWYVPTTSSPPVPLAAIEFPVAGLVGQTAIVAPAQIIGTGAVVGYCLAWNGTFANWSPECGGGGGSFPFSVITSGTNNGANMVVGSGATLDYGGTGTIDANKLLGSVVLFSGTPAKLVTTVGSLATGDLLSINAGNAVDSGISVASVQTSASVIGCPQLPAWSGDVTKPSGTCVTTAVSTHGVPFGTAATANTGTGGHTLPFLDGANAWTALNNFNAGVNASGYSLGGTVILSDPVSSQLVIGAGLTGTATVYVGSTSSGTWPTFTVFGRVNDSQSLSTQPFRQGTGSPVGRDACYQIGETYFQTDAVAGQNIFGCTAAGTPGTWSLEGGSGSGTITHTLGPLTAGAVAVGNGGNDLAVLPSLGTTGMTLHANTGGNPGWALVALTTDVSGILPTANGGLASASIAFTGPSGGVKTFTLPNVSTTILTTNALITMAQGGTGSDLSTIVKGGILSGIGLGTLGITAVGVNGKVLTANSAAAGGVDWETVTGTGGTVTSIVTTGPITGGTITASGTIACATCVTSAAALIANQIVIGGGLQASAGLGSLGTTTTQLHGNAAGPPSFGPTVLTTDVSGVLPVANGGIGPATGTQTQFLQISPNTGNNTTFRFVNRNSAAASDYNWPVQTPGGSLTASSPATITLTPCPLGIKSSTAQWAAVYISAGTGAAESVIPSGGTCTSGLSTGNITFTPLNNHTGAWTLRSATGGIQEAVYAGSSAVAVPSGNPVTLHSTVITTGHSVTIFGDSDNFGSPAVIASSDLVGDMFYVFSSGGGSAYLEFQNITLYGLAGINVIHDIGTGLFASHITCEQGIFFNFDTASFQVSDFSYYTTTSSPEAILISGTYGNSATTDSRLENGNLFGLFTLDGIVITGADSLDIINTTIVGARYNIYINPPSGGSYIANVRIIGGELDAGSAANATVSSVKIAGAVGSSVGDVLISGVSIPGYRGGPETYAIDIGETAGASIFDVTVRDCYIYGWQVGIGFGTGSQDNSVSGNFINGNLSHGISMATPSYLAMNSNAIASNGGYGINWTGAASSSNVQIQSNNLTSNTSGAIQTDIGSANFGTGTLISGNVGLDTTTPAVSSTAVLAMPLNPNITVTGTTGVTSVTGQWAGRTGTILTTSGVVSFTAGASIGNSISTVANVPVSYWSDGTKIWFTAANGTQTIYSGSITLPTSSIASAACATVGPTTATGVLTTDHLIAQVSGDPTSITGYAPLTTGNLEIWTWLTAGNVNVKVCNPSSSPIVPGALNLVVGVTR